MKIYKNLLLIIPLLIAAVQGKAFPKEKDLKDDYIEKVFVVNIVHNEQKLQEYLHYHSKVWPQVEAGFKKAGYKRITLYRFNYLIVMTIMVPKNADLDKMGKLAEAYNPKCGEWNKLMGTYQTGVSGTSPGQTWVEARQFYQFKNQ